MGQVSRCYMGLCPLKVAPFMCLSLPEPRNCRSACFYGSHRADSHLDRDYASPSFLLSARARDHAHDTNRRSMKVKSPLHESEQRTSTFAHFHRLGGRIGGPAGHRHCTTEPLIRCHRSGRSDVQSDWRMMGIRVVKQGQ
jgi:hypothetical protein